MKKMILVLLTVFALTTGVTALTSAQNCAQLVTNANHSNGTFIEPGTTFENVWRLRNSGSVPWNTDYKLVRVSGNYMESPDYVELPNEVLPGETVEIRVVMTAPDVRGNFRNSWKLETDDGVSFGMGSDCNGGLDTQLTTIAGKNTARVLSAASAADNTVNPNNGTGTYDYSNSYSYTAPAASSFSRDTYWSGWQGGASSGGGGSYDSGFGGSSADDCGDSCIVEY